uniref:Uromodulin n=1 Tax=Leptobrachium leishanense TaxID=445787 RepID=A0A8C5Q2Z8_9ANUR
MSQSVRSCNKSKCHANATCEEFGGYQDCTCKQGFSGNGIICNDTNECDYYWDNQCNNGYCINTIGSYVCSCYPGFVEEPGSGCVEADECANDNLNDCHALAVCTNYYGSYACSCPYGYYGDGRYCEINECQNENICPRTSYCVKSNGSFSCLDPCSNYTVIDEQWRLTTRPSNINNYWYHCDHHLQGWFRFQGLQEQRIPEYCVPEHSCGTHSPMWLNGVHPTTEEGIANRTACANWAGNCCLWSSPVTISACPGGFYVYRLYGTPACHLAYCTGKFYTEALNCSTAKCSSDEECKKIKGISQCHCKQDLYESNGLDSFINSSKCLSPNLECGSSQIKLSYSKCLLDRSGYDTSTIHLRDYSCMANIEREDISYVRIDMLPRSGSCGVNESHITYMNTLYIKPKGDGIIQRGEVKVGFSCSYPLNMAVSLWIAVNPFVSTIDINIGGTGTFKATMALYQFADYTGPYEGSEVWMSTESMAYVGVMVENPGQPNLVVVMKDCYATPTAESWHPVRYSIIKNSCRNLNDPTISVAENGVSLQGRFSVQVFKFIGYYDKLYLHCQIQLCDVTTQFCVPVSTVTLSYNIGTEYREYHARYLSVIKICFPYLNLLMIVFK